MEIDEKLVYELNDKEFRFYVYVKMMGKIPKYYQIENDLKISRATVFRHIKKFKKLHLSLNN